MAVEVGKIYRTPFEPSGLVRVLEIESFYPGTSRRTAFIEHVGNHPHGYKDGSVGRYFADELIPTGAFILEGK